MRFSLRDLFLFFVFAAIFCWCAVEVGIESGAFWFVVIVSTIMAALFLRAARRGAYNQALVMVLAGLAGLAFLLLGMFISFALVLNFVLLLIFALYCVVRPPQHFRTVVMAVATCATVAFVIATLTPQHGRKKFVAMRAAYPLESLASRLAYENTPQVASATPVSLAPAVEVELVTQEKHLAKADSYTYRRWHLEALHSRRHEVFVRAQGFGVSRMLTPSQRRMEREPLRNITFENEKKNRDQVRFKESRFIDWREGASAFENLHAVSRSDFLEPDSLGYVREPRRLIAGFEPHAASVSPTHLLGKAEQVVLQRLELVSLLKFPQPRVYVLDHLPRMDQLSALDAPTRDLDEFESASLAKLQAAEDVVIDETQTPTRMLGSLRAGRQCLECHQVQRGALLGAFSYALRSPNSTARGATP